MNYRGKIDFHGNISIIYSIKMTWILGVVFQKAQLINYNWMYTLFKPYKNIVLYLIRFYKLTKEIKKYWCTKFISAQSLCDGEILTSICNKSFSFYKTQGTFSAVSGRGRKKKKKKSIKRRWMMMLNSAGKQKQVVSTACTSVASCETHTQLQFTVCFIHHHILNPFLWLVLNCFCFIIHDAFKRLSFCTAYQLKSLRLFFFFFKLQDKTLP